MLHSKVDFSDVSKVKDLKMGRACWIIQVDPIQSHETFKRSFPNCNQRDTLLWENDQRDTTLLVLQMEQGVLPEPRNGGRQPIEAPLEPPEGTLILAL